MLQSLHRLHHIGICVSEKEFHSRFPECDIQFDPVQGVHTYWTFNDDIGVYFEYFTTTGRAKNYKEGYNHICFNLNSEEEFSSLVDSTEKSGSAVLIRNMETSHSKECGKVGFLFYFGIGIVEYNVG